MREGRPTREPLRPPSPGAPAFHFGESAEALSGHITTGQSTPWRPSENGSGDTTGQVTLSGLVGHSVASKHFTHALSLVSSQKFPRLQVTDKTPGPQLVTSEGQDLLPAAGIPGPVLGKGPLGQGLLVTLTVRCAGHATDH